MKGGYLGARERWSMVIVWWRWWTLINILVYVFSTRLSFYHACQDLVSRANRALLCIMSKLYRIDCKSINVLFFFCVWRILMFKCKPIALCGAEIWGLEIWSSVTDNVHLFGLKRYLGVDRRTPNDLVYGEVGRLPIQINACVCCIRYWLKLMRMEEHRLPLRAYKMLLNLDQSGKLTVWLMFAKLYVQTAFLMFGIIRVWDVWMHLLGNSDKRLTDIRWQAWDDHVNTSDRFSLYRQFKH